VAALHFAIDFRLDKSFPPFSFFLFYVNESLLSLNPHISLSDSLPPVRHVSHGFYSADIPYILENLEPQLMYVFRFAAKNQVGFGEWSREEVHTMPKRAPPEEPSIIAKIENRIVTSSYPDRYELLWTAPANNGEPIDYFEVVFYPVSARLSAAKSSDKRKSFLPFYMALSVGQKKLRGLKCNNHIQSFDRAKGCRIEMRYSLTI
jgi:hypothetical protein